MPQTPPENSPRANYQSIFDNALHEYKHKTRKDLPSDPLFHKLQSCGSPDDIITTLRQQIPVFDQSASGSSDDRLTRWLDPTVKVINAFSAAIGGAVSLAYPPGGVIFTGIGILLSAITAVIATRGILSELFERIENVFRRLEVYIEVPPTVGMTDALVKVMVEILRILAIVTKEIRQSRAKTFVKRLMGRKDIEEALQTLEKVTVEEARMAAAEALKAIHGVGYKIEDEAHGIHDAVEAFGNRIEGMIQRVDDRVKGIGDMVITGRQIANDPDVMAAEGLKLLNEADNKIGPVNMMQGMHNTTEGVLYRTGTKVEVSAIYGADDIYQLMSSEPHDPRRTSLQQAATKWLSPPDPSVNYHNACDTHHEGTTTWFIDSTAFKDWKQSGSLFWIHGKPGSGKSVVTSAIIQDIERIINTGPAYMAYFFFDFKDTGKQDARAFLSSVLVQLSNQSVPFCNILLEFYSSHQHSSQQPSDRELTQCLEKMLKIPIEEPIYFILDALDECPDTSGLQSSREKVLELVKKLFRFHLPYLRLCVTSRPEIDIRNVLEPLTSMSSRISLHDEDGQKRDIADYVRSVVYSDSKMMRWREQDKELVIETLSGRANGMFRWTSCQIEAIRRCLAPSLRRILEELPETLDETYERILREIPKANQVHAHRLLQCLTVAIRPLRVQELAEVLAVEFGPDEGIAKLNEDLRWEDQEQAVLSACSSLIAVVDLQDSRVVQFSHFSVQEFLTSERLAASPVDILSCHHIRLEPAHTIMAQACIGALLHLELPTNKEGVKKFPLVDYAAKHFADHAEFKNVISHIVDGVDHLLDADKPHYSAWMSHISSSWWAEKNSGRSDAPPLYYVPDLGYDDLAQRPQNGAIMGDIHEAPVHTALHQRHVKVIQLLLSHCTGMDNRDSDGQTPLHVAASNYLLEVTRTMISQGIDINAKDSNGWTPIHQATGTYPLVNDRKLDIMQLLLERSAEVGARENELLTPLHLAAKNGHLVAAELLLQHGMITRLQNKESWTPLHYASSSGYPDMIQLLLQHDAKLEAQDNEKNTPLHLAALEGKLTVVEVLLKHGANIHAQNSISRTPLHYASFSGHHDVIQLLLEHGADVGAQEDNRDTPLHLAAWQGKLTAVQVLLKHSASIHSQNTISHTPLHLASYSGKPDVIELLLEHGAELEAQNIKQDTPLHLAAWQGQLTAVQVLLKHRANVHVQNDFSDTPLHLASHSGHSDVVELLLEHVTDLEAQNREQNTPLHLASHKGMLTTVQVLLKHGASIHAQNNISQTPLHLASLSGHSDVIELLLEQGAELEARNGDQNTPLHLAVLEWKLTAVEVLLKHGASIHAQNNISQAPLHIASHSGQPDVIELLLEHGAELEVQGSKQDTPLHLAAWQGKLTAVEVLLKHGASVHARDNTSQIPLHLASFSGYPDVIQLLLEHGANLEAQDVKQHTPLHAAAVEGKLSAVQVLLKHGASIHALNNISETPLHLASFSGHPDTIQFLLENGAKLESQNSNQDTSLHLAARQGQLTAVQRLVEHGAIVQVRNKSGRTPLHQASLSGSPKIIQFLLEHGVDADGQDDERATSLHLALDNGNNEVARVLLEHGVNVHLQNKNDHTPFDIASENGNQEIMALISAVPPE